MALCIQHLSKSSSVRLGVSHSRNTGKITKLSGVQVYENVYILGVINMIL